MSQPIPGLTPITSFSHFRNPLAEGETSDQDGPQLIMIFGWSDARFTHVLHYSRMYAKIYPMAPQVIVECDAESVSMRSYSSSIERMRPVVKQLEKLGLFTDPYRLLVHSLSSGGIVQLHWLTLAINQFHHYTPKQTTLHPIRPTLLVLDSSPSVGDYAEFLNASTLVRGNIMYLANRVLAAIYLRPQLRKFILDFMERFDHGNSEKDAIFQPMHHSVRRLYLYSDVDIIALDERVRGHIGRARTAGVWVNEEYFRGSPHVMHARMYPEAYWTAVRRRWDDAVERVWGGELLKAKL
ncbi:hypothetical protein C8F01DRAFT_1060955 [Mycena amicta]|nr:hypothetical protein C8F01DRAFT_1060955 [Mycena amicta]